MTRPYFNYTIEQLELEFVNKHQNQGLMSALLTELSHRNTPRARKLMVQLIELQENQAPNEKLNAQVSVPAPKPIETANPVRAIIEPVSLSKENSENILSAWSGVTVIDRGNDSRQEIEKVKTIIESEQ